MRVPLFYRKGNNSLPAMEIIVDDTIPSGQTGIFDVTDISQAFDHLQIFMTLRTTAAAIDFDNLAIIVNSDTVATNYRNLERRAHYNTGSVNAFDNYYGSTVIQSNRNNPDEFSGIQIDIPFYSYDYAYKTMHVMVGCNSKLYNYYHDISSLIWKNVNPITALRFSASTYPGGDFIAFSNLKIVGIREF